MAQSAAKLISVVIPSYNDREIIRPFHTAIIDTLQGQSDFAFELIYIDDGSSDGSPEVLRELAAADERVVFVEFFRNVGQQKALFAGLMQARGDIVVCIDGDYQYEPTAILDLARALGDDYDMASGVRVGRVESASTRLASYIGNRLINSVMGSDLKDFGSIKAFSRALVDRITLQMEAFGDVYSAALYLRPSTTQVELEHRQRFAGVSHWNFWKRLKLYLDLYAAYGDDSFLGPFKFGVFLCGVSVFLFISVAMMKWVWFYQATYIQIGAISFTIFFSGLVVSGWSLLMSIMVKIFRQNTMRVPFAVRHVFDCRQSQDKGEE